MKKTEKVSKDYKKTEKEDVEIVNLYSSSISTSSSSYSIDYQEKLKEKSYDSLQEIKDEQILRYPHEKQFCTKELPRFTFLSQWESNYIII